MRSLRRMRGAAVVVAWAVGSWQLAVGSGGRREAPLPLPTANRQLPTATSSRPSKPTAPLEIVLTPLPRRKKDAPGVRRLRVSVTPRVGAPGLEVSLALPSGVTLVEGELRWKSRSTARVTQSREVALKVPRTGERRLVVTGQIVGPNGLPMAEVAGYTFNPRPADAPSASPLKRPALRDPRRVVPTPSAR